MKEEGTPILYCTCLRGRSAWRVRDGQFGIDPLCEKIEISECLWNGFGPCPWRHNETGDSVSMKANLIQIAIVLLFACAAGNAQALPRFMGRRVTIIHPER